MSKKIDSLHERLRWLITSYTTDGRRFKELEEQTGIPTATWKSYWTTGTRPSSTLIEAAATTWPEHAFWLATGFEDPDFGHTAARSDGFPHKLKAQQGSCTSSYFKTLATRYDEANEYVVEFAEGDSEVLGNLTQGTKDKIRRMKYTGSGTEASVMERAVNKLRQIEVLVDIYMPLMGYDDTERMLDFAKAQLQQAREAAKESGHTLNDEVVAKKIAAEVEKVNQHKSWTAKEFGADRQTEVKDE